MSSKQVELVAWIELSSYLCQEGWVLRPVNQETSDDEFLPFILLTPNFSNKYLSLLGEDKVRPMCLLSLTTFSLLKKKKNQKSSF
jgi:hypothetical protein